MTTSQFIPTEIKRRASQTVATPLKTSLCENTRQIAQHTKTSRASGELPADTQPHGTMGLSQSSTRGQSDAGGTPRRHTDTAERWVSPKARRGDSRTPGELLAGIPTPRNDGSPPKLDAGTVGCRANSSPAYRHRGTMGLPQSSTRARHSARPGASGLPASTQA